MEPIGQRLRELRLRRGLTSTALAKPFYSVSYVSQIERGKRRPSPDAIAYFARRLKVSAGYLATGVPDDVHARLGDELEAARQDLEADLAEKAEERIRDVLVEAREYDSAQLRARALILLGEALIQLPGQIAEAIAVLQQARQEELTDREAKWVTVRLAAGYCAMGDLRDAIRVIEGFLARGSMIQSSRQDGRRRKATP